MIELWRKILADDFVGSLSKYCCNRYHAQKTICTNELMDISIVHVIEPITCIRKKCEGGVFCFIPLAEHEGRREKKRPVISAHFQHSIRHTYGNPNETTLLTQSPSPSHRQPWICDLPGKKEKTVYPFLFETGMLPSKISLPSLAPHIQAKSLTALSSSPSFCPCRRHILLLPWTTTSQTNLLEQKNTKRLIDSCYQESPSKPSMRHPSSISIRHSISPTFPGQPWHLLRAITAASGNQRFV